MYRQRQQNNKNKRQFNPRGKYRPKQINPSLFINKVAGEQKQPEPVAVQHQFSDFAINDQLKSNILEKGYTTPTPIQDQVIPVILQGKDVVGIANTGTGKTGAFLIPLINKVLADRTQRVLIIAPTRELAVQIQDELTIFSKGMGIFSVLLIGGVSMHQQTQKIRRNPNVVIGTPGRIKDLKNQGKFSIAMFNNIVLDEVDRMLDMGFINDMKFIISHLPMIRQSLFFSATIPQAIVPLMQSFLRNPVTVSVKTQSTALGIQQDIVKLNGRNKVDVLHDLLAQEEFKRVIVFGRTKWGIEKLSKLLIDRGFRVVAIHGNKNQNQRQRALNEFKNGQAPILLATDVAARGLDIEDVSHVINYDQPESYDDYVHRIGRTGRAEKKGIALTFID
jgi:ATP-dependent RNA helicase RhlE